jgi:hypothetical protein
MTDTNEGPLRSLDEYLRYQGIDPATAAPDVLAQFLEEFDKAVAKRRATLPMGEIFKPKRTAAKHGDFKIAVAVRDGDQLWATITVRRDPKGDVYVLYPRHEDNPHASYHRDGTFHHKSANHVIARKLRQPLNSAFKGCEHIGVFAGHGPKTIGAICNPANFSEVVEVPRGILGPRDGFVAVDLVEPGCAPLDLLGPITHEWAFKDSVPWIVVRVGKQPPIGG